MPIGNLAMTAFIDELLLIKAAEEQATEDKKEEPQQVTGPDLKRALKNLALGALAYGVGAGSVRLAEPKLRQLFSGIQDPAKIKLLGTGVGLLSAAGSLAFMDAMAQNSRMLRESAKSDK